MTEHVIKFVDENVDGCGTNIESIAIVHGKDITDDVINDVKSSIEKYQNENPNEWDTDSCLDIAKETLESKGYDVKFICPTTEIHF